MIQDGFPKLAIYNPRPDYKFPFYRDGMNRISIPKNHRSNFYQNINWYTLSPNELIILVHDKHIRRYNYQITGYTEHNCYFVVPLNAIEKGLISKGSIYRWTSSYSLLPLMAEEELTIVNKDELEKQMKREAKK